MAGARALGLAAAPAALVRAESVGCPGAPSPALFEAAVSLLRVELASEGVACCGDAAAASVARSDSRLRVRFAGVCGQATDGSRGPVDVFVVDDGSGRGAQRRLDLADVPPAARPRTLALAAAESVRALRREHASGSEPSGQVTAPADVAAAGGRQASPEVAVGGSLGLGPLVRVFPRAETVGWGGVLGASGWRGPWWAALEADLSLARRTVPEGTVSLRTVTTTLAAGARLSLAGRTWLTLGPSLALGRGSVRGTSAAANVRAEGGDGWSWALSGRIEVAHELGGGARTPGPRYAIFGAASAGGVLHGLEATVDDRRVAGASGFVGTLVLGVAWLGGG